MGIARVCVCDQDPKLPHARTSKRTIVSAIIPHSHPHMNLGSPAVLEF